MYFNIEYLLYVAPALLIAMYASYKVKSVFNKYSRVHSDSNLTGANAARLILDNNGLNHVRVEQINGELNDHFDPKRNIIRLSTNVYNSTSVAAIGVAAHEVGHAIQYANNYLPLKLRNAIIPLTNIGSKLSMPLILIGVLFAASGNIFIIMAYLGIAFFAFSVIFQLLTLPTEFNASNRALKSIEQYQILDKNELTGSRHVLSAAALTYVAALAVSISQLLYLLTMVDRRDN